jgi:hypothetical protein
MARIDADFIAQEFRNHVYRASSVRQSHPDTGVRTWTYNFGGKPPPPAFVLLPPLEEEQDEFSENASHHLSNLGPRGRRDRSLDRGRDGLIGGLDRLSRAVSRNRRNQSRRRRGPELATGQPETESAQEHSGPSHLGIPSLPARNYNHRRNGLDISDNVSGAHDADDSFFLHGKPTTVPPNILLPPARMTSPVLAQLRPSSDYAKKGSLISSAPDGSMGSYLSRLNHFLKEVGHLPWSTSTPTVSYYPGRSHSRWDKDSDDGYIPFSWYALMHRQYIDLLSSESSKDRSLPPDSAIAYQPNLAYEFGAPTDQEHMYAYSDESNFPVYPHGYVRQESAEESQEYPPSSSVPIHGPPVPEPFVEESQVYPPSSSVPIHGPPVPEPSIEEPRPYRPSSSAPIFGPPVPAPTVAPEPFIDASQRRHRPSSSVPIHGPPVPLPTPAEPRRQPPSNSVPIYGPPVPGHLSGNPYPYPTIWPPPLPHYE